MHNPILQNRSRIVLRPKDYLRLGLRSQKIGLNNRISESSLSLTGSASRTDLSQLANGIWEIHAGYPSFLRVSSVAKIGYIPQFKASNVRDQDEVSSDLARMPNLKKILLFCRTSSLQVQ